MGRRLTRIKLDFVHEYKDRHGKTRRYVRRPGLPRVPLKGLPGSTEFMDTYKAAISGAAPERPSRHGSGSMGALITSFYRSTEFSNLSASSQATYRLILGGVAAKHGHRLVKQLEQTKARKIIEDIGVTRPGMANLTRKILRRLFAYAISLNWRTDNPFASVPSYKLGEHHTWTDDELKQFEQRWPLGTRERLTYALLLYTGQRLSDVTRMKRAHIKTGFPVKTKKTSADLAIPIHPEVRRAVRAMKATGLNLITDINGRPIQTARVGEFMAEAIDAANLPDRCVPHGLRKANQRLLAEHGGTTKELQAVSGHATLSESERYTRLADQKKLARSAMAKLPNRR